MKNQARIWTIRTGHGQAGGVMLGIGALVGACVAGYALYTIFGSSGSGSANQFDESPVEQGVGLVDEPEGDQIASTESIEEILGAVQVYVQNEQFAQATTVLEHAAGQYRDDQELQLSLGDLYMIQERYEDAYIAFVSAIAIGPASAKAEFTAGTLANMLNQLEAAEMHFGLAMRIDSQNPDTPMFLAAVQMKMNKLTEAKKNLAIAGKMAPGSSRVFAMRSEVAMRENKPRIALEQIRKARVIEPDVLAWLLAEAKVLKRAGQAEEALGLMASLGQEEREILEVAYLLAECYGMLGRAGDSASFLMDIYPKHKGDGRLAFEIALWLDRSGEDAGAMEWAQRAAGFGHPSAGKWVESKRVD